MNPTRNVSLFVRPTCFPRWQMYFPHPCKSKQSCTWEDPQETHRWLFRKLDCRYLALSQIGQLFTSHRCYKDVDGGIQIAIYIGAAPVAPQGASSVHAESEAADLDLCDAFLLDLERKETSFLAVRAVQFPKVATALCATLGGVVLRN